MATFGPNKALIINDSTGAVWDSSLRALLRALDVLMQPAVISKSLTAPPGSPANGDRYIVGASPTGAWSGKANYIAVWTTDNPSAPSGEWEFYLPKTGWVAYSIADSGPAYFASSSWTLFSGGGGGGSSTLAGLTDVTISSPSNGQVLTYDSTSSKWKNQSGGGGGGGGNVNADTHPGSPTAWDDEFEAGSLDPKWTTLHGPSNSFGGGSIFVGKTPTGSTNVVGIYQSLSGAGSTWQFDAKLNFGFAAYGNGDSEIIYGILLYDAGSSNKLKIFGPLVDGSGNWGVADVWFDSNGSLNSYQGKVGVNTSTSGTNGLTSMPQYFRIRYDGSALHFTISYDGIAWSNDLRSESFSSLMTPDSIGLGIDISSGNFSGVCCDWFRKTA